MHLPVTSPITVWVVFWLLKSLFPATQPSVNVPQICLCLTWTCFVPYFLVRFPWIMCLFPIMQILVLFSKQTFWVQNIVLICRRIKWESTSETMWVFQIVCVSSTAPDRCWCGAAWVPWQNHQWFSMENDHSCVIFCGLVPTFNRFLMSLSSGLRQIKEKWVDECLSIWFLCVIIQALNGSSHHCGPGSLCGHL